MYTSLYFPQLSATGQRIKDTNTKVNSLILKYDQGEFISDTAQDIITDYIILLNKIVQEIKTNKSILIQENILPEMYKR